MKQMIFAAAAFLALAAPVSAQYGGYYYGHGYGGGYDGRGGGWYGRRGYDTYEEDYRPRRDRRRHFDPYSGPYAGRQPAGPAERPSPGMCVTPHGSCRVTQEMAAGVPCSCSIGGFTSRGQIY